MTNVDFLKEFQTLVSTLDALNTNILPNILCLLDEEVKKLFSKGLEIANEDEVKGAKKSLESKTAGRLFLIGEDWQRYRDMKSTMQLNIAMGTNNYPNSLEEAMNIMNTHQQLKRYSNK